MTGRGSEGTRKPRRSVFPLNRFRTTSGEPRSLGPSGLGCRQLGKRPDVSSPRAPPRSFLLHAAQLSMFGQCAGDGRTQRGGHPAATAPAPPGARILSACSPTADGLPRLPAELSGRRRQHARGVGCPHVCWGGSTPAGVPASNLVCATSRAQAHACMHARARLRAITPGVTKRK
jgi:hypothetical protein